MTDSPPHDGLPLGRRVWAAAAIFAALSLATLNIAIVHVALPAIASSLGVSAADVVWVVNAYQIAMVMTLLPLAALGEIVGHRRVYLGGLVLFIAASLVCALAWSLPTLIAARALQGLGASGLMSVNTALVRYVYPARLAGRGFAHNALVVGLAFTLGPTIASAILAVGTWPWLFAFNVPIGIATLLIGLKTLPSTPRSGHAFDLVGAALAAAALGLVVTGIGQAAHGGTPLVIVVMIAAGVICGALLLRRQAGHPAPILPIDLFRIPVFALSAFTALAAFCTQSLAFVALPFYIEQVLHRSPSETGALMTPWPLVVAFMAPVAARMLERYPVGLLGGVGLALLCAGMAALAMLPAQPAAFDIGWRMALCGCGFGFFQAPNMTAIMGAAPAGRSGGASGIVATARLTGQTMGAALAALCFSMAGTQGATTALALGAGFAALGSVLSFARLRVAARP